MITSLAFFDGLNWIDGRPLVIEPYRTDIFRRALDTYRHDGIPQYNMVVAGRAKKNFKSADMICAGLFCLMCRESPQGSDVLIVANDKDQADQDLDLAKKLVMANGLDDPVDGELIILADEIRRRDGKGTMRIIPAQNAIAQHGKTAIFIGYDEIHGYANINSLTTAATSETARAIGGIVGQLGSIILEVDKFALKIAGKIASLSGLFTTLGGIPWDQIRTGLASFTSGVTGLAGVAWEKLSAMFDGIRNAISSFIDAIANIIGKAGWLFGFGNNKIQGMEECPLKHRSMFNPDEFNGDRGLHWQRDGTAMPRPIMFNPGTGGHKPITVNTALNVDGQTLAQSIIDNIDLMTTHPTGGGSFDGVGRFSSPSMHWDDT
ncbi:hypothetical protein QA641_15000 [Bradyrhizobium sp. CB1650]|uniref:hypothetical protein n=1 Tax=Bradyrhizobium sp. CB1650 TaxID=3039153 RepID=UPI002434FBC9|nr:hypothetical protein [Bradyrhizobium sp. CB1650]WGD55083.1 hypothetical protein QA641_15000 [Bradyrhizobium sp. CB1650]